MSKIFCFFSVFFLGFAAPLLADNISVIGIGRIGLTFALCLENAGHNVLGVDVNPEYIDRINKKTLQVEEPGINEMLQESQNFRGTLSLKEALDFADIYFIFLSSTNGVEGYNFAMLTELLSNINTYKISNKHIVINTTLSPGFINNKARPLLVDCTNVTISYNPSTIAYGEIIQGTVAPDLVLIGQGSTEAGELIERFHRSMCKNTTAIVRMSVESAEIAKLALNCFITSKIAFANLVGEIADETPGANKYEILKAVGEDSRIGPKNLKPGYGFGGTCFIRDNWELANYADTIGLQPVTFRATDTANNQHAHYMAKKLIDQNLEEYIFENVSYKPNSSVSFIYASQKLVVAKLVAENGKRVIIVDKPSIINAVKAQYGDIFIYRTK